MPGRERFRAGLLRYVEVPGAKLLRALGFTPNAITILGFLLSVAAAVLVAYDWLWLGGIVFLVGGGLDLFDGGLARLTGTESPFGALLDSVFDRLGEAALLVGLGICFRLNIPMKRTSGSKNTPDKPSFIAFLRHR